jgi:hypothetical protein
MKTLYNVIKWFLSTPSIFFLNPMLCRVLFLHFYKNEGELANGRYGSDILGGSSLIERWLLVIMKIELY